MFGRDGEALRYLKQQCKMARWNPSCSILVMAAIQNRQSKALKDALGNYLPEEYLSAMWQMPIIPQVLSALSIMTRRGVPYCLRIVTRIQILCMQDWLVVHGLIRKMTI